MSLPQIPSISTTSSANFSKNPQFSPSRTTKKSLSIKKPRFYYNAMDLHSAEMKKSCYFSKKEFNEATQQFEYISNENSSDDSLKMNE